MMSSEVVETLICRLCEMDPEAGLLALAELIESGHRSVVAPVLRGVAMSSTAPALVRAECLEMLVIKCNRSARLAGRAALCDGDPLVRFWGAYALSQTGVKSDFERLIPLLHDEGLGWLGIPVSREAAWAIGEISRRARFQRTLRATPAGSHVPEDPQLERESRDAFDWLLRGKAPVERSVDEEG